MTGKAEIAFNETASVTVGASMTKVKDSIMSRLKSFTFLIFVASGLHWCMSAFLPSILVKLHYVIV